MAAMSSDGGRPPSKSRTCRTSVDNNPRIAWIGLLHERCDPIFAEQLAGGIGGFRESIGQHQDCVAGARRPWLSDL